MPASYPLRPHPDEYAPYYANYVARVPDGDILHHLAHQTEETLALFRSVDNATAERSYAPDKWSWKDVAGHLADSERIFAYRALCFSRLEAQPIPGFDQEAYVRAAGFNARPLADLLDELTRVRAATLALFQGLTDAQMERTGTANGVLFSVRAFAYFIAGHERHHLHVLRERYLTSDASSL